MSATGDLQIRFWGVRGSHPAPGPKTATIGGNTSCVEIDAGSHTILFDAGTGIIPCGKSLLRRSRSRAASIFVSHLHHDHIEGLRFFPPLYRADWHCDIYGSESHERTFAQHLAGTMGGVHFPVEMSELAATVRFHGLSGETRVDLNEHPAIAVESSPCGAHPRHGVRLYRLRYRGRTIVYATDVEGARGGFEHVARFAAGADVLIHDAQYTDREYERATDNRQGWGHSTARMAAEAARAAAVGRLFLFHHDPNRTDAAIPAMERAARRIFPHAQAAREGLVLRLH